MIVSTVADTRHTLTFEGLTEHGFIYQRGPGRECVLMHMLTVTVVADADSEARVLETAWSGSGAPVLADGTLGKATRKPQGGNLNSLPLDLRAVVLDAIEDLGVRGIREDLDRVATRWQRANTEERARIEAED